MFLASFLDTINSIGQFLTVVVIFIFVVGITLIATRWIANYQKGSIVAGNIEVVETFRLATNKYVQIIRIGTKYLVIAIGRDEVTLLSEIPEADIQFKEAGTNAIPDFAGILAKFKKKQPPHCDYEKTPPEDE
jgi:flagellar protein FliO/FliZ